MKVLVTGFNGQLGFDVVNVLTSRGISCRGADIADFDITDENAVREYISSYSPDAVVHCAAYTAVDKAEEDEEKCRLVNAGGTENIAKVCGEKNIKMLYVSTDYVFAGSGDEPFETDSALGPKNVYGRTKLEGETAVRKYCEKHFIVRTSWVFGKNGGNFVKTMLRLSSTMDVINVVSDQTGSPTYTPDLAVLICDMIATQKYGTYHATNEGYCSWAEFAAKIMELSGADTAIKPILSKDYNAKAQRPHNSRLSKKSLDENGFRRLPHWEDALKRYLKEIQ